MKHGRATVVLTTLLLAAAAMNLSSLPPEPAAAGTIDANRAARLDDDGAPAMDR